MKSIKEENARIPLEILQTKRNIVSLVKQERKKTENTK
jgi:hypothetical protein